MQDEVKAGLGSLSFWGNTPATNLLELMEKAEAGGRESDDLLLVGSGDCRHVLKTLNHLAIKMKKNEGDGDGTGHWTDINVSIFESNPTHYARILLQLHLAFMPLDKIGLQEKTTQFLELFGNLLVRPQTKKTLKKCADELIRAISDAKYMEEILPMVDLSEMRHRERDMIAEVLKFWRDSGMKGKDIQGLWDKRVRHALSTRYDARMGVFDWDYQMRMVDKNPETKIVHIQEYKTWRDSGMAFNEYQHDYSQPNLTLLTDKNSPFQGDILLGPFIPFGVECEDESLLEKTNREFKHKSSDLSTKNVEELLESVAAFGANEEKISKVKIIFLPFDTSRNLWKKSKFSGKFDFALISSFAGHHVTSELAKLMRMGGVVAVENSRFLWYFRKENDTAYQDKVKELGVKAGLQFQGKFISKFKDHLVFAKN